MAPIRRPAAVAPAAPEGVSFLSLGFYTAGGGLPEGDYALEFNTQNYQATKQTGENAGPPRLGVMVTAHSLTDPAAEPRTQFYSMGSNADKSFAPDATGKGLVPVAGAVGTSLNMSTNWAIFLKSLYDCGLPENLVTNDLSVLDGVWVHLQNIPEPQERKGFGGSKTGEVVEERRAATIAVVSEIKEDGKPWENTGGIGAAPVLAAPPAARRGVVAPAARPAPRAVAPVAPVEEAVDEDAVMTAAVNGVTEVLVKPTNANGCTKLALRTGTFKAVNEAAGPEMAQTVLDTFFSDDASLSSVLGQLGYKIVGTSVKPQ